MMPEIRMYRDIPAVVDTLLLRGNGAQVFATTDMDSAAERGPTVRTGHPLTGPIALVASFHAMVGATAQARGINPDAPCHLRNALEEL